MWFRPMGLNVCVATADQLLRDACSDAFGGFGPGDAQRPADLRFDLSLGDGEYPERVEPVFRFEGSHAYAEIAPHCRLAVDLVRGVACGRFPADLVREGALFRHHFLQFGLNAMLPSKGFLGLHAAALVKDGRGVLLRGASGVGKTVLTYAGARSRFQALADSTVWVLRFGRKVGRKQKTMEHGQRLNCVQCFTYIRLQA